jgi:hypothetical protein
MAERGYSMLEAASSCWKQLPNIQGGPRQHGVVQAAGVNNRAHVVWNMVSSKWHYSPVLQISFAALLKRACLCCYCMLCLQRLVLDDNRSNAAMALACTSRVCTYRFQQPLTFYECRLLQLQWWRTANSLRCGGSGGSGGCGDPFAPWRHAGMFLLSVVCPSHTPFAVDTKGLGRQHIVWCVRCCTAIMAQGRVSVCFRFGAVYRIQNPVLTILGLCLQAVL